MFDLEAYVWEVRGCELKGDTLVVGDHTIQIYKNQLIVPYFNVIGGDIFVDGKKVFTTAAEMLGLIERVMTADQRVVYDEPHSLSFEEVTKKYGLKGYLGLSLEEDGNLLIANHDTGEDYLILKRDSIRAGIWQSCNQLLDSFDRSMIAVEELDEYVAVMSRMEGLHDWEKEYIERLWDDEAYTIVDVLHLIKDKIGGYYAKLGV